VTKKARTGYEPVDIPADGKLKGFSVCQKCGTRQSYYILINPKPPKLAPADLKRCQVCGLTTPPYSGRVCGPCTEQAFEDQATLREPDGRLKEALEGWAKSRKTITEKDAEIGRLKSRLPKGWDQP
jgi:hypothetical protein